MDENVAVEASEIPLEGDEGILKGKSSRSPAMAVQWKEAQDTTVHTVHQSLRDTQQSFRHQINLSRHRSRTKGIREGHEDKQNSSRRPCVLTSA